MANITREEVQKISKLAKLRLTEKEAELYQAQFSKILDSMAELRQLDTEDVPPTTSVLGLSNVLREDSPAPFGEAEDLLANAPEREGPYYKVRKVIE